MLEYKDRPSIESIMNKRHQNFDAPDLKSQENVKSFLTNRRSSQPNNNIFMSNYKTLEAVQGGQDFGANNFGSTNLSSTR